MKPNSGRNTKRQRLPVSTLFQNCPPSFVLLNRPHEERCLPTWRGEHVFFQGQGMKIRVLTVFYNFSRKISALLNLRRLLALSSSHFAVDHSKIHFILGDLYEGRTIIDLCLVFSISPLCINIYIILPTYLRNQKSN